MDTPEPDERHGGEGFTASEGRKFGYSVGLAFLVLTGILLWREHVPVAWGTAVPGGLLILGATLIPGRLGPAYRAWMALARKVSAVTTPIVMGGLYYLFLTPVGIVRRTLGRSPMERRNGAGSYWASKDRPRSDLRRQF